MPVVKSAGRRKSKAARPKRRLRRLLRWPVRLLAGALAFSVLWVVLYRFVPVPIDFYMAREAIRLGMKTLRQSALSKLVEGHTTLKEVLRVSAADHQ